MVIIHTGRNDFQNNINTIQKLRKVISTIKEYDTDYYIKIGLYIIFKNNITETNIKLKISYKGKSIIFINKVTLMTLASREVNYTLISSNSI